MLEIDPLQEGPTPLPAATVILLRDPADGGAGLEALLVQRHKATAFMGGAYVFPGGKLDAADASPSIRTRADGADDDALLHALGPTETLDAATARALYVAAARETFEEAGILLGRTPAKADAINAARTRLNARTPFEDILASLDARLSLERLLPLSRWVTPSVERRRFDARFFVCHVTSEESARASIEEHETVASRWLRPAQAVALHLAAEIDLPPPTLRTLELLATHPSAAAAVMATRGATPPLVQPVFHADGEQWTLALPGDALHPLPHAVMGPSTRFACRDGRWFSA